MPARLASIRVGPLQVSRGIKAGREMEAASLSGLAVHPQLAVHQLDQARGDGQAESGPSELAGGRSVGLRESLEDQRLFVLGDADAGVPNVEAQRESAPPVDGSSSAADTATSPASVNLMALPTRLVMICPTRTGSPTRITGDLLLHLQQQFQALRVRPHAPALSRLPPDGPAN